MIPLNIPANTGHEKKYINEVLDNPSLFNEGKYLRACSEWFGEYFKGSSVFLTKSCTHSLELTMMAIGVGPGDEVILPSYTFVSAANAIVLQDATPVFIDLLPDTMNMDPECIEAAITEKTKAIVVMHYAGVGADMDRIMSIAAKHNVLVIEDAAHGIIAKYKDRPLGSIGDFASFSFEQMKNLTCGQGGLMVMNNQKFLDQAEVYFANGTDKLKFLAGERPFYQWTGKGSNFKISELQAAYLFAQLEQSDQITQKRLEIWDIYANGLRELENQGHIRLPKPESDTTHNAHIFFIKTKDNATRTALSAFLKDKGIMATFHYQPLHTSLFGKEIGRFHGEDIHTTRESELLLRLPLYYSLEESQATYIVESVTEFYT